MFCPFWFNIASIATWVLPVCLSPIINSLCPLPIGTRASIALIPVSIGSWTDFLAITPVATLSIGYFSLDAISHIPSIGLPKESTTLPIISGHTGTSKVLAVAFTFSPSLIELNPDKTTTQTKCSSKLRVTHTAPDSNSTNSLYATFLKPETFATPSHK